MIREGCPYQGSQLNPCSVCRLGVMRDLRDNCPFLRAQNELESLRAGFASLGAQEGVRT